MCVCVYACIHTHMLTHKTDHIPLVEDRGQQKLVLSFHHVGTEDPTQTIKPVPAHCQLIHSGTQSPNTDILFKILVRQNQSN